MKKSILMITSNNQKGGIHSSSIALFRELSRDFEIELVFFGRNVEDSEVDLNGTLLVIRKIFEFSKITLFLARLFQLIKFMHQKRIDFVICQDPSSTVLGYFLGYLKREIQIVAMCHVPNSLLTSIDKLIIRKLYSKQKAVVVPSVFLANEVAEIAPWITPLVIPNMMPQVATYCEWPREKSIEQDFYIFFGRLEPEKNPIFFVEMAKRDPKNIYVLCGLGSQLPLLETFVSKNLISNVIFLGDQPISRFVNKASLMVIPSLTEAFGIVAIESWLQGVPTIVSTQAQGVVEMMSDTRLGVSMSLEQNSGDWIKIAESVSRNSLTDDAIRRVLEKYHASAIISRWQILIEDKGSTI